MRNVAHLNSDSVWLQVFPDGCVPIINMVVPGVAEMIGDGVQEFYSVDVKQLSDEQIALISKMVAEQTSGTAAEVEEDMRNRGMIPLRRKHVSSVSVSRAFFI